MAAYAAVVSLHHTINALLPNLNSRVSSSTREILELAEKEASSLLQVLEGLNGSNRSRSSMETVDALEGQIRDCAHKLEDVLEFHELKQLEEEEDGDEGAMGIEIRSFCEAAKRLEEEYLAELSGDEDGDDDDEEDTTAGFDFGVEMIGRSRLFKTIKRHVVKKMRPDDRYVLVFRGEQGSGTRVVVNTIFEKGLQARQFERWGWVKVGRGYERKHVLMMLIVQVEADVDYELLIDASEDGLSEYVYKALENRNYMIVLDGLDDVELLDYLLIKSFPDEGNGSVVLVTTISPEVDRSANYWYHYVVSDVHEEDIWLYVHRLWASPYFPAELEVVGKEIVHNCRNQYIAFAKTIVFLSKSDKTVEQWGKLVADKENPIFTIVDEISEISEIRKEVQYCERIVAQIALDWVDFSSQVELVNATIYPERFFSKMQIISFFGMAGIGKTNFARNIFKDDSTLSRFDHHVWIPIGPRYQTEEILIDILAKVYPHIPKLDMKANETLIKE